MKSVLLVIDIQKDYFPGGKMPLVNPEAAAHHAYTLLQCFREHGGRHVHIQHLAARPNATFFIPGERGADIHDLVAHFEGEPLVQKHAPNAFHQTNLLNLLRGWGAEQVVICGMMTHLCVDATARAAADLGFQILIASDACATRDLTFHETTVPAQQVQAAFLAALQSYGQVLTTEQVIAHLAHQQMQNLLAQTGEQRNAS